MIISITSIELKSPLKFFELSFMALHISNQLKASPYVVFKKKGFWTKHYTMTLWRNEEDMRSFAHNGAHLDAMKKSKLIAKEIKTLTIAADQLPNWKEAQILLKNKGRIYRIKPPSSLYKNENAKFEILKRYNQKQQGLKIPTEDIYVDTFAGKTHILASGNVNNPPVVLLHAFNAGSPVSLEPIQGLQKDYRLYALDTVGQTTKSDETRLSLKNDDYGKWISEVLSILKIEKAVFIGISYGAFLQLKLMQVAPQKISKSILVVPGGIVNGNPLSLITKVTFPMLSFLFTKSNKSLKRFMDSFYTEYEQEDVSFIKHILLGTKQDHRKPPLVNKTDLENFMAPTYVMVADDDIFFPAKKVIEKSKSIFKNLKECYVLENSKHAPSSKDYDKIENKITDWLGE